MLLPVFNDVFGSSAKHGSAGASADGAPGDPDELRVEEMAAYRAKLSRWAREGLEAMSVDTFWMLLKVMRVTHQPVTHHMAFMMSERNDTGHLALLVHGGSPKEICASWEDNLTDSNLWANMLDSVPLARRELLVKRIMLSTLHHAAAYDRRVLRPLGRFHHMTIDPS